MTTGQDRTMEHEHDTTTILHDAMTAALAAACLEDALDAISAHRLANAG